MAFCISAYDISYETRWYRGHINSALTLDENFNIFIRGGRFLISKTRIIPLAYVVIFKNYIGQ